MSTSAPFSLDDLRIACNAGSESLNNFIKQHSNNFTTDLAGLFQIYDESVKREQDHEADALQEDEQFQA